MPSQPCAHILLPCLLPLLFEILLIELKCLYNIILSLAVRIVFWNIRFQSVKGKCKFGFLIWFFLIHNVPNFIVVDFAGFIRFADTDCLIVRRKCFGFIYTVNNISLSFLIKLGKLHGGTHFHLTFIHKVLQLVNKIGKADIALNLCLAFT